MNTRSFTDQKRRIATEEECKLNWNGDPNGATFKCYMCGHKFKPGDGWRWILCPEVVNFMVCDSCDGDDVKTKFVAMKAEFNNERFWWFRENERIVGEQIYMSQ